MAGKKRSVKLQSEAEVNCFLAKIINMLNRDEIDPTKAGRLGYLCNLLTSGLRRQDLEERISKLERMVKENGKSLCPAQQSGAVYQTEAKARFHSAHK